MLCAFDMQLCSNDACASANNCDRQLKYNLALNSDLDICKGNTIPDNTGKCFMYLESK